MKNSVIYIVGATVLLGGAYLFLKNKKKKDLAKLTEIGGTTTGGATTGGATSGGATSGVTTPNLTEPVKINKDLNLDAYNLQQVIEQLKNLDEQLKAQPKEKNDSGVTTKEWWNWYFTVSQKYRANKQILLERLSKLGYKYDNGLLVKI
jgi:hypothetical protein